MNRRISFGKLLGVFALSGMLANAVGAADGAAGSHDLVVQGNEFHSQGKMPAALWAYRQAAKAGSVDGALAAGNLLFLQAQAESGRSRILDLSEGLRYLFTAATNQQPQACAQLSAALQNGLGVRTNLVAAYAWLLVAAENNGSFKTDLDRLVLQLEPRDVLAAQKMAHDYLAGHWPARVARVVAQGDPRLEIQGVSQSPRGTLIILNGDTLTAGESANVVPAGNAGPNSASRLTVSCREIGRDYVLVAVAGESELRLLPMAPR